MSAPNPEVLQRMLEREEARKAARAAAKATTEIDPAVETFLKNFYSGQKVIAGLCASGASAAVLDADGMTSWRDMESQLSAAKVHLPSHELTRANVVLQDCLSSIQLSKASSRSSESKIFSFRKVKTTSAPPVVAVVVVPQQIVDETSKEGITNESVISDRTDETLVFSEATPQGALFFSRLTRCVVKVCPPIPGSIMIKESTGCEFHLCGRQLRIHHTTDSVFFTYTPSDPVIEGCHGLKFGPYTLAGEKEIVAAGLELGFTESYKKVQDFSWMKPGASPNWEAME